MNRIREIREAAGLSVDDLGERCMTSGTQIRRLETGARRLTEDWMTKIGRALDCAPADLMTPSTLTVLDSDVALASIAHGGVAEAMARKGLVVYNVTNSLLTSIGIHANDIITVDNGSDAIKAIDNGDVVLVEISQERTLVLRQYLKPGLLTTNKTGTNSAIQMGDNLPDVRIVGVVLRS